MPWKRLALLPLGILVYLLVIEGGLQIAAYWMKRTARGEIPAEWVTGNLRVLCLGDSNTYGVRVQRNEAYPQQLEALWNERIERPKLEVLNLGFPGTNSSRLVRDLPRLLEAFEPDRVIVMVGVNDFWTLPVPLDEEQQTEPRKDLLGFLQRHSVLYRLYYLFQRGRVAEEVEFQMGPFAPDEMGGEVRLGDQKFELGFKRAARGLQGDQNGLIRNLRRLVEQAGAARVPLYLMTYPAREKFYSLTNPTIEGVASGTDTPLIDLAESFTRICPTDDCPGWLLPDQHPTAVGYRRVAETIVDRLAQRYPP